MTTLAFTQHYNPQSITWAGASALWATLRTLALLVIGAASLAAVFAVVAAIPLELWIGLSIIAVYALATMPRKAVRK